MGIVITSYPVIINGKSRVYSRLTISLPDFDFLVWLENQTLFPKFYWKSFEEFAALDILESWNSPPIIENDPMGKLRICGGQSFSELHSKDAIWNDFPKGLFFLPSYEMNRLDSHAELVLNFLDETPSDKKLRHINFSKVEKNEYRKNWHTREDLPNFSSWKDLLNFFLESKSFEKVVLARRTTLHSDHSIQAFSFLRKIRERTNAKVVYALQIRPDVSFIGATPERLYRREGKNIFCDAIAGTFVDTAQAKDPKIQREFNFVKQGIIEIFQKICSSISSIPLDSIMASYSVNHLCNKISGTLHSEITDSALLNTLHPTPAIGGFPKNLACQFIAQHEPFERGWYSAPIGFLTEQIAEFAVAIRCALILDKKMHLFAGLGVVDGSDPNLEWDELELKIRQFL